MNLIIDVPYESVLIITLETHFNNKIVINNTNNFLLFN